MSNNPSRSGNGRGVLSVPDDLRIVNPREVRENKAIGDIEARLEAGSLSPEDADREILELALERFAYLPKDAIDELREVGLLLNEEPEMVESRALAPKPKPTVKA